jgi:hypothetical protein
MSFTADSIAIADAVVAALNAASTGGDFVSTFTAVRKWTPSFTQEDMAAAICVCVIPFEETGDAVSRAGVCQLEDKVDVAILRKVPTAEPSDVDPLVALLQQLGDYFKDNDLGSGRGEHWTKTQLSLFDEDQLRQKLVYFGLATLTFTGVR